MSLNHLRQKLALIIESASGTLSLRPRTLVAGDNLTLTDNGDGSATLAASAGGSSSDTFDAVNADGATINKGEAVILWSASGGTRSVIRAGKTNFLPPIGVATADVAIGATGTFRRFGELSGIDTSAFSAGDVVYVGTSGALIIDDGSLTSPTDYYHRVGVVTVVDASTGAISVELQDETPMPHHHRGAGDGNTLSQPVLDDYANLTDQGSDPAAPSAGTHRLYSKAGGVYVIDSGSTVVGPLGGAFAGLTLAGDTGTQAIADGDTITVSGGVGLVSTAGATDKVTVDLDINSLTADGSPDSAADYVATYDASASAHKKVLLSNLPGSTDILAVQVFS